MEKLVNIVKSPLTKRVQEIRKALKGKKPKELMAEMNRANSIIMAGEGIKGAERLVAENRAIKEATRQELEK